MAVWSGAGRGGAGAAVGALEPPHASPRHAAPEGMPHKKKKIRQTGPLCPSGLTLPHPFRIAALQLMVQGSLWLLWSAAVLAVWSLLNCACNRRGWGPGCSGRAERRPASGRARSWSADWVRAPSGF